MKKISLLLTVMIAFVLIGQSQNNKGLEDGLVAYYPFNGNANDESGNTNDGTIHGASLCEDRFENPNSAYYFNGSSDYIDCGNDSSLDLTQTITISAWMKPDIDHSDGYLLAKGTYQYYAMDIGNGYGINFTPIINGNHYTTDTDMWGIWKNVAFTYSVASSNVLIYIDGILENTVTYSSPINSTTQALQIGRRIAAWYFKGVIDDIRIYNRVLTEEEIQALYHENMFSLNLHLFLEGPYNGTNMNTDLNPEPIPLSQPYNDPQKWNYQGTESVASIPNGNIVDWVLVELRETSGDASTAIADSMIAIKAAFLLKDGSIVDLDGESPLYFDSEITDNLYVVVYHRNHLPVMSSAPLTKINGGYSWDFTTPEGQAYGTDAQKNFGTVYGMFGGDSDANGIIDMADKDIDWINEAGRTGYFPSDLNMDTEVNNPDKNDIWKPNLNTTSQIPEPWICGDPLLDERDGQTYNTVQIGTQCWIAENLNIGTMINGSNNQIDNSIIEKYCYDNNTSNCDTYGGLYQWDEMMQYVTTEGVQGICPSGWHIPTDAEWCTLENYVDDGTIDCEETGWRGVDAGGNLKETGLIHWNSPNTGATNSYGFTSLPCGNRNPTGTFESIGFGNYYWTSSINGSEAWRHSIGNNNANIYHSLRDNFYGQSVRCLQD